MEGSVDRCDKKAPPHGCAVEWGVTPTCFPHDTCMAQREVVFY
jgi:hypothetical protein